MEDLKQAIITAPCLQLIDYCHDWMVILAVDSSCIANGFILLQLRADIKRYPSCFGSITWNDRNHIILRLRLRFMAFGTPFRPTSSISLVSGTSGWKSMPVTSKVCLTIQIFNQVQP